MTFNRSVKELEKNAVKWWPKELEMKVAELSVIPKLIATQDNFISILTLSGDTPEQIFDVLTATGMPANLFLKHLCVLTDYGGEKINRLGREFESIFLQDSDGKFYMMYLFKGYKEMYKFQGLPIKGLGNKKLDLDGPSLIKVNPLNTIYKDIIMILLHGSTSEMAELGSLEQCVLGSILGEKDILDKYIKEKYIYVSRIVTGASANDLGQIAQTAVVDHLRKSLDNTFTITKNGKIILEGYNKKGGMPFDLVIERKYKKIGIEVSFQVTTNSTIERKAGQASERRILMNKAGFWIAYVLDGAGNFQRSTAISAICNASDCTVAYSESEFDVLVNFIKEKLCD